MGDCTPSSDGDFGNLQYKGGKELIANEIPWDNNTQVMSVPTNAQNNPGDGSWSVSAYPNDDLYKTMQEPQVQPNPPTELGEREPSLQKLKWKPIKRALSPARSALQEVNSKSDIRFSDTAFKKLASDSEHLVRQDAKGQEQSPSSPRSPKTSKGQKTGGQGANLGKQSKMMSAEKNKRRKSKKEDEPKTSKQPGEIMSRTKGMCVLCGVENLDGSRSICKSCINRQKKEKSKQALVSPASKKVLKTKIDEPHQTETEDEDNPLNVSSRSVSFDLQESVENLDDTDKKHQPPNRTNTDLGPKRNNSLMSYSDIKMRSGQDYNEAPAIYAPTGENVFSNTVTNVIDVPKVSEGFSIKQKNDDNTTTTTDKKQPGTKNNEVARRSLKRSTTDSEIVGKCKSKENNETSEETKATVNAYPGARLHGLDSSKRKDPPKEFDTKPGRRTRESSDPNLVSHRKTSSSESVNEGNFKMTPFKLERSKTTFGKVNYDRDRKSITESEKARTEGNVVSSENASADTNPKYDKTMVCTEQKSKKFFNPSRAHTIIGDGNTKRQKPKLESTKPKSEKNEHSFSSDTKERRKIELSKDEPIIIKMEKSLEGTKPIQRVMPNTLYNYNRYEEDGFQSDSEDECDSILKGVSIIELPTIIPETNDDDQALETANVESTSSESETGNDATQMMTRLSEYGTAQYDRIDRELEDNEFDNNIDPELDHSYEVNEMRYGNVEMERQDSGSPAPETFPMALSRIAEESGEESAVSEEDCYFKGGLKSSSVAYDDTESDDEVKHGKDEGNYQNSEMIPYTPEHNDELNTIQHYTSPGMLYSYEVIEQKAVTDAESSYTEMVQPKPSENVSPQALYTYETDVDTGMAVAVTQEEDHYVSLSTDPWGLQCASNSDSSVNSDDKDKVQNSDSWNDDSYYTEYKSKPNEDNDDLVYFEDKAAKKLSDSDIYTGGIFNSAQIEGNDQRDKTKNNSTTIHEHPLERSNFWNISSRPQMHQLGWRPQSTKETERNVDMICSNWLEGQCRKECNITKNHIWLACDVSNNCDGFDDGEKIDKPSTSSTHPEKPLTEQASNSEYTEYNDKFWAKICDMKPKKDLNFYEFYDFSKYDTPQHKESNIGEGSSFSPMSYLTDVLFFGEESTMQSKPQPATASNEQSLYFNTQLLSGNIPSSKPRNTQMNKDDDYQGGWFSTSKYESNNVNNNADGETESYTGCFRNEEELKPTHEGLFNGKASTFVFQKRTMNSTPNYFCNDDKKSYYDKGNSDYAFDSNLIKIQKKGEKPEVAMMYYFEDSSKSYYDKEDSVYAFEEKKKKANHPNPKLPQVFKVGGIVVRNNVEREVDYAKNIDMDLQEAPKPWVRYDITTNTDEMDTSNYAQNVSYDNLTGTKPWAAVDGSRTPWRENQFHAGMKKNKESKNTTWTDTPDN